MFISRKDFDTMCDLTESMIRETCTQEIKLKTAENNNILILKENKRLIDIIKEIEELSCSNTYNNANIRLRKIKELASNEINS